MRYSERAFPAYRFVPGKAPHPTRDPDGHSFDRQELPVQHFDEDTWAETGAYLYGVDLFNHGYWWEAHESWEACWVAAGRRTETGFFIQGLIQIAVACLKHHQGFTEVARRMAQEGLAKLPRSPARRFGIDVGAFHHSVQTFIESGPQAGTSPPTITLQL